MEPSQNTTGSLMRNSISSSAMISNTVWVMTRQTTSEKLKEIRVQNFRHLADVTIPIGDTTVLVGANNSAKTALPDALRVALIGNRANRETPFPAAHDVRLRGGQWSTSGSCRAFAT